MFHQVLPINFRRWQQLNVLGGWESEHEWLEFRIKPRAFVIGWGGQKIFAMQISVAEKSILCLQRQFCKKLESMVGGVSFSRAQARGM